MKDPSASKRGLSRNGPSGVPRAVLRNAWPAKMNSSTPHRDTEWKPARQHPARVTLGSPGIRGASRSAQRTRCRPASFVRRLNRTAVAPGRVSSALERPFFYMSLDLPCRSDRVLHVACLALSIGLVPTSYMSLVLPFRSVLFLHPTCRLSCSFERSSFSPHESFACDARSASQNAGAF